MSHNPRRASLPILAFAMIASQACAQEYLIREDMPDHDQGRVGLPGDGWMHCYPTSMVDMFRYMDEHGLPFMMGSYGTSFNDITNFILFLGTVMGTNTQTGTNASSCFNISKYWVDAHTNEFILKYAYGSSWDWGYTVPRNFVRMGGIIRVGYGRYKITNDGWDRYGGHSVFNAGWITDGFNDKYFVVADPATDGNINNQGAFQLVAKQTSNITLTTTHAGQVKHPRYTLGTGNNNDRRYVVDNMEVYQPFMVGWPTVSDFSSIRVTVPFQMNERAYSPPTSWLMNVGDTIVDWCFDMRSGGIVYLAADGRVIESDITEDFKTQIANIPGATRIAVGGSKQDLYVLKSGVLTDTLHYVPRQGGFGVVRDLGMKVGGLDFDEVRGGPVVARQDLTRFITYTKTLGNRVDEFPARLSLIPPRMASALFFKVDHETGNYIAGYEGTNSWTRFVPAGKSRRVGVQVFFNATKGLQNIAPSEQGSIFVQDDGKLQTLNGDGSVRPSRFTNMVVSDGTFRIPRSVSAVEPNEFVGARWVNVVPVDNEP